VLSLDGYRVNAATEHGAPEESCLATISIVILVSSQYWLPYITLIANALTAIVYDTLHAFAIGFPGASTWPPEAS